MELTILFWGSKTNAHKPKDARNDEQFNVTILYFSEASSSNVHCLCHETYYLNHIELFLGIV